MPELSDIRKIWEIVEGVIEEAIIAAEGFVDLETGDEKKQYVTESVVAFLRSMEDRHDVLPTWAEAFALNAIEFSLDWIIERVFDRLDAQGKVNAGPIGQPVA